MNQEVTLVVYVLLKALSECYIGIIVQSADLSKLNQELHKNNDCFKCLLHHSQVAGCFNFTGQGNAAYILLDIRNQGILQLVQVYFFQQWLSS